MEQISQNTINDFDNKEQDSFLGNHDTIYIFYYNTQLFII